VMNRSDDVLARNDGYKVRIDIVAAEMSDLVRAPDREKNTSNLGGWQISL